MMAKVLGFAFSFVLPILLSRVLNLFQFGLYKQAFQVIQTAQTVLPLGISMSAFYFLPREKDRQPHVVFNILLFNFVVGFLAFLLLLFYPKVLVAIFGRADMVPYAPWIGAVIFFWIFSSFLEAVATANQEVLYSSLFIVTSQFTKSAAMIGMALLAPSVKSLLIAVLIQCVIQTLIMCWYCRSRFPGFWKALDIGLLKTQLAYALPLGLAGFVYTMQTDLHNYFVANAFGPTLFAIYSVGCAQIPLLGLIRESMTSVTITRVSILEQQGEIREIVLLISRVFRKIAFFYLPSYAFLMVAGRDFITALYTSKFADSWPIMAVNLLLIPLNIFVTDPVIRAFAKYRFFILTTRIILLGVLLAALHFGILRFGVMGAVYAVIGIAVVERIIMNWKVARILQMRWSDLKLYEGVLKLIAASALAAAITALARSFVAHQKPFLIVAICAVIYGFAYLISVVLLRAVEPDEVAIVRNQWLKIRQRFAGRLPDSKPVS